MAFSYFVNYPLLYFFRYKLKSHFTLTTDNDLARSFRGVSSSSVSETTKQIIQN